MVAKTSHDWEALKVQLKDGLKTGKVQPNWVECAKYLGLHPATFRTGLEREWGLKHPKDLIGEGLVDEMPTRLGLDVAVLAGFPTLTISLSKENFLFEVSRERQQHLLMVSYPSRSYLSLLM